MWSRRAGIDRQGLQAAAGGARSCAPRLGRALLPFERLHNTPAAHAARLFVCSRGLARRRLGIARCGDCGHGRMRGPRALDSRVARWTGKCASLVSGSSRSAPLRRRGRCQCGGKLGVVCFAEESSQRLHLCGGLDLLQGRNVLGSQHRAQILQLALKRAHMCHLQNKRPFGVQETKEKHKPERNCRVPTPGHVGSAQRLRGVCAEWQKRARKPSRKSPKDFRTSGSPHFGFKLRHKATNDA